MSQQSRTWQQKYLDARKDTADLYWYAECQLPVSMRKSKLHDGWTPVGYPGKNIPVVPVGNDWKASRRIADMLCWIFRVHAPQALEIAPVFASRRDMDAYGSPWRVWTEDVLLDCVCASCGAIEAVSYTIAEDAAVWLCVDCVDSQHCNEFIQRFGVDGFKSNRS